MKKHYLLLSLLGLFLTATRGIAQTAVSVGSQVTAVSDLVSGRAYLIKYTSMTGTPYIYDAGTSSALQAPSSQNSPTTACAFYFLSNGDGTWKLKNQYTGNYWPTATGNARLYPTASESSAGSWAVSISSGAATLTCTNGSTTYGLDRLTPDVVSWSSRKTVTLYEVDESVDLLTPTASEVYIINNTNSYRGPLTYDPAQSDYYVWTSGKSGATAFDATSANCQWVFYPTGTEGQYYLYNVGADRFAIPDGMSDGAGCHWVFSHDAVAVMLVPVGDGTYKIQAAKAPVSGSNNAYVSVSIGQTYPIINYNDAGSQFTITKVTGANQSTAVTAAVNRLVGSQTALTAAPSSTGWYAVQIRTAGTSSYVGRYVKAAATEYTYTNGATYSLTFAGEVDVQPAISDVTYYTRIVKDGTSYYWQMPNGRYLVPDGNGKFPTSSVASTALTMAYSSGNTFRTSAGMYAVPYNSGTNYFVGESSTSKTYYVYPINLITAGLTAWQMVCNTAPETQEITCSRSDLVGPSAVYKNGFFFLPSGVTPTASDFGLEGSISATVSQTAHTVTFQYDPNLALVESGVSVEQGWQTAGRDSEVMLLRVTAEPFKAATGATMTVSLKDGAESEIASLTLYEASDDSPEILSTGTGAPTKTAVSTVTVSGSTATFSIGSLTKGTHYYWIGATVKSTATLGSVIDAAVTGITYTCNSTQTTLDLTAVGDPADRGAMVFNTRSYPFLPRDNSSRVYRIPAMVVADDGSIVVACDKRYDSHTDIGKGHVIDIVVRRSTDGGKTWSSPVTIAKGDSSNDATCGYGDPSLVKGKDGKLYCLFGAGNLGYGYGLKRICMSTSTDNGVTWSSSTSQAPTDLYATGAIQNAAAGVGNAGGYGLYDYFVTSGRGLYTSDGILMYLIPAQTLTADNYSTLTDNTYWSAAADDYLFYSTDDGQTWYFSQSPMIVGGDEAKVIEMNDGSLFGSIRKANSRRFNSATYTANGDGTLSFEFGTQWDNSQLSQTSQNNQDIYYYQRAPKTGKTDVIIHSITTGTHANFELYYSTDQGLNWTKFLNVQTKGTRYVTLERGGSEENPGSLYVLFEDQSLNATGGYSDYNHYPLNFIEITREQLESLIPVLAEEVKEVETKEVKIVYATTPETTYGTTAGDTWTSNNASGLAGLTLTKSDGSFNKFSSWNGHYNLAYLPGAANVASTLTLTAPEGYVITGYSFLAAKAYSASHTYTITTSDGQTITPAFASSATGYTEVSVTGLHTTSEVFSITTSNTSYYMAIANFVVQLESIQAGDVNKDGEVNEADIPVLVRVLLGKAEADEYDAGAANVDGQGGMTLADVTALVNLILSRQTE